jgi:hypothetical protein
MNIVISIHLIPLICVPTLDVTGEFKKILETKQDLTFSFQGTKDGVNRIID